VFLAILKIKKANQKGSAKERVRHRCVVRVKIYGKRPKIFNKRIIQNILISIFIFPFVLEEGRDIFISFDKKKNILLVTVLFRLFRIHNLFDKKIKLGIINLV
jgi:hypothetical protein